MTKIFLSVFLIIANFAFSKAQDQYILPSRKLAKNDTVWIFKPQNQDSIKKKLPVVYLLHGWAGNYKQWHQITNLQVAANRYNFIIVCPDGLKDSWYINSPTKQTQQYSDFFFDELIPFINKNYNSDITRTFISGLSMGGHGALHLFFLKPWMFLSAGSSSGPLNLKYAKSKRFGTPAVLGEYEKNKITWASFSAVNNVKSIAKTQKKIIFDCGIDDILISSNDEFWEQCKKQKIKATYIKQPGKHNTEYWSNSIHYHFLFFHRQCITKKQ